ncbi:MAG: hypothetical protein K0U41_05010 [Gammaproteobacteria bacterium]|nr:hypothetical protein [Gammaproteobacteria bacterium]
MQQNMSQGIFANRFYLVAIFLYGLTSIAGFYLVSPYCSLDYPYYAEQWQAFIDGKNPYSVSHNTYAIGHSLLGIFYYLDHNLPRYLFLFAWLSAASFIFHKFVKTNPPQILEYLLFIFFYLNPIFWVTVSICANNDAIVAPLVLLALAFRRDKPYLGMAILVVAGMTKIYPLALMPLYALNKGQLNIKLLLVGFILTAIIAAIVYIFYGPLSFNPFIGATFRNPTQYSIYSSLANFLGPDILKAPGGMSISTPIVLLMLALTFFWCWINNYCYLSSCLLGSIVIMAFYALIYQHHYLILFLIFTFWYVIYLPHNQHRDWQILTPFILLTLAHIIVRAQLFFGDFIDFPWNAYIFNYTGIFFFALCIWLLYAVISFLQKINLREWEIQSQ